MVSFFMVVWSEKARIFTNFLTVCQEWLVDNNLLNLLCQRLLFISYGLHLLFSSIFKYEEFCHHYPANLSASDVVHVIGYKYLFETQ